MIRISGRQLSLMVVCLIVCFACNFANAQNVILKDTRGRTIEVRIISATDTHVSCIKAGDEKEISITLNTLDAESQKKVNVWRIESGRLPRKEMSRVIKSAGSNPKTYLIKFKVPEGNYNSAIGQSNGMTLNFDKMGRGSSPGKVYIEIDPVDQRIETAIAEISREFQEDISRQLQRLTPSERATHEPTLKIQDLSHGDFKGYLMPESASNPQTRVKTTNGKFAITFLLDLSFRRTDKSLIEPDDMVKILETLVIEKHP
jgi:hypothetical protein